MGTRGVEDTRPILPVGWDVGGWLGKNQAVAVLRSGDRGLDWPGCPSEFRLAPRDKDPYRGMSFLQLIQQAWPEAGSDVVERHRIVLAVDAPLGLPLAWQRLIAGERPEAVPVEREIDSSLAYRETDRWVHRTFKKKPLSATFDRLGNNASVAIWHLHHWANETGQTVAPRDASRSGHPVAIEVYPALTKVGVPAAMHPRVADMIRLDPAAGAHARDAAICAVHALAFALNGHGDLPALVGPPGDCSPETLAAEGWIYSFPPEWLRDAG